MISVVSVMRLTPDLRRAPGTASQQTVTGNEEPLNPHLNFQGNDKDKDGVFNWQEHRKLHNTFCNL